MMRLIRSVGLGAVLIGAIFSGTKCSAAKHCYATKNVAVLDGKSNKIATIKAGTTFNYLNKKSGYVQLNYYGRLRYVRTKNLIVGSALKNYVRQHPSKFSYRISAIRKGKIFFKGKHYGAPTKFSKGERFSVFSANTRWYQVYLDGVYGYIRTRDADSYSYVDVTSFYRPLIVETSDGNEQGGIPKTASGKRAAILKYAKKFLGNPYVWGGNSLTNGTDCSGYVRGVMKAFGIDLPRCSYQQATVGKLVKWKDKKPGDLIFYTHGSRVGHVAMYAGNGKMYHAKGRRWGIVCTDVDTSRVACVRNVID